MKGTLLSSEVAEPYAQALMSLAKANNLTDSFGRDLRDIERLLEESPELDAFITNPVIEESDKKAVIKRILGEGANPYLTSFLMLLVDKRRIVFLKPICEQYLALLRDLTNTVLAEVTAARQLSEEQERRIEEDVKRRTGANAVELKVKIDPDIIGGVVIKVGSQIFDASLRGQLRRLRFDLSRNA